MFQLKILQGWMSILNCIHYNLYAIKFSQGQFNWNTSKAVREDKQAFLARNHGSNYLQIKLGNIEFNESIVVEYIYLVSLRVSR